VNRLIAAYGESVRLEERGIHDDSVTHEQLDVLLDARFEIEAALRAALLGEKP
jgi:hypothetical protein